MQSKGAIKLLAIVLALVCLYQLSFTLVTRSVENNAREFAKGDEAKEKSYLDSMASRGVYNLGLKDYTYMECKEREINLGLDLKGGMNVTMEVSVVDLIRSMANHSVDPTFTTALAKAEEMQKSSQDNFVTLFGRAFKETDPNAKLAAIFTTVDLQNRINFNSTNEQVLKVIDEEAKSAISRSYNILRTRIDKFGVSQPNIQQLDNGRILIELPGVKEPDRVRKLLQGTAKLEFWETYNFGEVVNNLVAINKKLGAEADLKKTNLPSLAGDSTKKDSTFTASNDSSVQDSTGKNGLLGQMGKDTSKQDTSKQKSFEEYSKENPLFSSLIPADYQVQTQDQKNSVDKTAIIGYCLVKDTSKVNAFLSRPDLMSMLPKNFRALWTVKPRQKDSQVLELIGIKVSSRNGEAPLDGKVITDANKDVAQYKNSYEVSMAMNVEGAQIWRRLTKDNIGRSIAIILDNAVYSYPTVQGEIAGGRSSITGNFDVKEADDLANLLKAGKLPAPARIIEEAVVGPSLGQEAIQNGLLSFVVALLIVLLYMIFYYNNAGVVADVAMFVNIFFIMGVLASIGAVLTLPGIAGIVLIIGLSVDANILIFERIREELREGKGIRLAVSDGYKHALSSIIDSNVTTLLLGIILYTFGSGPVQGFATTLIIGILCSLFSAIFISRLIFEWMLDRNKQIRLWNPMTKDVFKNINIDFVGRRKTYYIISSIIILGGIISIVTKGWDYGVDFEGGRTYVVQFDKAVETNQLRDALTAPLGHAPDVKTFGTNNRYKITTTSHINENGEVADSKVAEEIYTGSKGFFANSITLEKFKSTQIISSQKVGPTIADDVRQSAVLSILFGCALMFLYILIRFRKWQYGLGATIALFHDVLVVLSFYSIFNGILPFTLEINQDFIAALLTVMGYSMTDTVVVFDRIREYLNIHPNMDHKKVINDALNATLSRTINTSLTIFFVLLAIFIFGGDVIRGFAFALLIGIVIGTYSSICIATPVVVDLDKQKTK
ncbi:MAG: protein translocase subunit SecDF [Bacteroidota bacterium]